MSAAIVSKDLTLLRREALVGGVFVVTVLLVLVSVFAGLQREQVFDKEKTAALATDEAVWMDQGDRNPHSAAHFSRYAFRPASPLGMLEPGTSDFAGLAIWMEAHYQDPAMFRRAEDGGDLSRYSQLTPGFLVTTVAPLIVFLLLFGSVAGEREDGTLRQLLATGVDTDQFFKGKLFAGLRLTLIAYTVVFVPVALLSIVLTPAEADGDAVLRLIALYVAWGLYLAAFVAIAIGASALFRSRQSAFLALTCLWAVLTILVPRFAADLGTSLHPQPDARDAAARLAEASSAYYANPERRQRIEDEVLERYDVATTDDLPINYSAYVLQVSEELSEPEFDRFYADLDDRYAAQEGIARAFSVLTPAVAMESLARGLAGTDRVHQREFAQAAEAHRREMIQILNEDYMYNAGDVGAAYTADASLWDKFEDFDYRLPALPTVAGRYLPDALLLIAWLLVTLFAAYRLTAHAVRGEVPTA